MIVSYFLILAMATALVLAMMATPRGLRGAPLVSCYTIVLVLFGLYFLFPSVLLVLLRDGNYVWATAYGGYANLSLTAVVVIVAMLAFTFTYHLVQHRQLRAPTVHRPVVPSPAATMLAWALVIAGILMKLGVFSLLGGVEATLTRLSTGTQEALKLGNVPSYIELIKNLSGIGEIGIVWLILMRLQSGRPIRWLAVIFAVILILSFAGTGKRLFLITPIIMVMLGVHYYRRPLRLSLAPAAILLVFLMGFATVMYRIYVPANLTESDINLNKLAWSQGSILKFYFFSLEYASFEFLSLNIFDADKITRIFHGSINTFYTTNIEPLSYFFPRFFWPGKPDVFYDISHANRVLVFGGSLKGSGIASTLIGTSWTIAGPFGMLAAMVALAALAAAFDSGRSIRGIPSPSQIIVYGFMVNIVFHFFRQGTLGWTAIIVISQQLGMIFGFLALSAVNRLDPHRLLQPRQYHDRMRAKSRQVYGN